MLFSRSPHEVLIFCPGNAKIVPGIVSSRGVFVSAKILALEDDPQLQDIFRRFLGRMGHQITGAFSLADGRRYLREETFDILLCDMRLPDGDGLSLVEEFRDALREAGTHIVVVSAEPQYTPLAEELDIEFFLTKPLSLQVLGTLLSRLLQESEEPGA